MAQPDIGIWQTVHGRSVCKHRERVCKKKPRPNTTIHSVLVCTMRDIIIFVLYAVETRIAYGIGNEMFS